MLSTKPYKGSRDFYPDEMRIRDWYFRKLSMICESFGFEKVDAPLIEPIELYQAKTSQEIVNQQIYRFKDRSGREAAIRPEMTPTISRMVSSKLRELAKPIRWYSLPNLWRYERPGRGRLREHWQLNADIFAAQDEFMADCEILELVAELITSFGAKKGHFILKVNHRGILTHFLNHVLKIKRDKHADIARILDKKEKVSENDFKKMLSDAGVQPFQTSLIIDYMKIDTSQFQKGEDALKDLIICQEFSYLKKLLQMMNDLGYSEYIEYGPSVIRGFDYYTGMVFEVFDTHSKNKRSLFGGGRYDNLVSHFGKESCNAVGFGMGDVTFQNFLEAHDLLKEQKRKTQVYAASFNDKSSLKNAFRLSKLLRIGGFNVETSLGTSKLKKQFEEADQKQIPFVILQGEDEARNDLITVKNMKTGIQEQVEEKTLVYYLKALL